MDDLINVDDKLQEIKIMEMVIHRNPKISLERNNPFVTYTDEQFYTNYRMKKGIARIIINLIRNDIMQGINNRGCVISPDIQVIATIRYLAKGAYGVDTAEQHGLSQPALSIIVKTVVKAIARYSQQFIKFPEREQPHRTKQEFYSIANCPNIVGAVDGTHVKIKCPSVEHPLTYINRKGYYSLNVQIVSDAKCRILDIVAKFER